MVVCYYGKYFTGQSVYWHSELTDWSYPPYVVGINFTMATVAYLFIYFVAYITQYAHGYTEDIYPTDE